MTRYNSNYGSHDQLQELRIFNMQVQRERDGLVIERHALQLEVQRLIDELHLAHEALKREFVRHGIKEVTE